jgi:hypothetical protein
VTFAFWRASKIRRVLKLFGLAGLLFLGSALALASCGSDKATSPATGTSAAPTVSYGYTSYIKSEGSSPARLAGDGRYFGYVRAADAKSQPPMMSFDVAQFFFGNDVQKAAEKDGVVAPGESVPNDHYERNLDTRARTLKIATDAQVTSAGVGRLIPPGEAQARCRSGCPDGIHVSLAEFFAAFQRKPDGMLPAAGDPVWVTIRDGLVVRIDEQYFP